MTGYTFNSTAVVLHDPVEGLRPELIEGTPNLRRARLSDAVLFGGPLVRTCLEHAPIVGDRVYVVVDTKVSFLMPGWMPAIPGWHTDGVPRGVAYGPGFDPASSGAPSMAEQQRQADTGYFPRYHTIIVGNDCPTAFVVQPLLLYLERGESTELYAEMTRAVDALDPLLLVAPQVDQWASWDWWNIHRATEADDRGWRLLIRVTESDTVAPATKGFIRAQSQVYVPQEFGW
ncbi:hypothetical protein [Mycolicibacterium palauense]|uniref:hypothetical protein n=1 Tax=Mycolicibacterium palauense TaxID=2034511 RepID=UPI0011453141|nr:hypothetical protein [Mycolicibacterium palauense]